MWLSVHLLLNHVIARPCYPLLLFIYNMRCIRPWLASSVSLVALAFPLMALLNATQAYHRKVLQIILSI